MIQNNSKSNIKIVCPGMTGHIWNCSVINPSKKMQDFRKSVCPTFEEMKEIFEEEVGKRSFH